MSQVEGIKNNSNITQDSLEIVASKLSTSEADFRLRKALLQYLLDTNLHKGVIDSRVEYRRVLQPKGEEPKYKPEDVAQGYSFSAEKLILILRYALENADIKEGDSIMLPFCGMGSLPAFLTAQGFNITGSDILYSDPNQFSYDPVFNIELFRKKIAGIFPDLHLGKYKFMRADAQNLPIEDDSVGIIIAVPPFNVKCKIPSNNGIELFNRAAKESLRILKNGGSAFYVIPKTWLGAIDPSLKAKVICEDIIQNRESNLPLSILEIEKGEPVIQKESVM